jgi:hypothetical protein
MLLCVFRIIREKSRAGMIGTQAYAPIGYIYGFFVGVRTRFAQVAVLPNRL